MARTSTARTAIAPARAQYETKWVEAQAIGILGRASYADGQLDAAWEQTQRSADIAADCGFHWWQARQLVDRIEVGLDVGRLDEGAEAGRAALRLSIAIEDRLVMVWALTGLARELARGKVERAGRMWGAVTGETERDPISDVGLDAFAAPLVATTEQSFISGFEVGRDAGLDGAVELALAT